MDFPDSTMCDLSVPVHPTDTEISSLEADISSQPTSPPVPPHSSAAASWRVPPGVEPGLFAAQDPAYITGILPQTILEAEAALRAPPRVEDLFVCQATPPQAPQEQPTSPVEPRNPTSLHGRFALSASQRDQYLQRRKQQTSAPRDVVSQRKRDALKWRIYLAQSRAPGPGRSTTTSRTR